MGLMDKCAEILLGKSTSPKTSSLPPQIITHAIGNERPNKTEIMNTLAEIKQRLHKNSIPEELQPRLTKMADDLSEFELGRFLIKNHGALSGYWTHYLISGHDLRLITNPLERFILKRAPVVLATRERFQIFQTQLKKHIRSNMRIASVPCGMMADLFSLTLDPSIQNIEFIGLDIDDTIFNLAESAKQQFGCPYPHEFFTRDAWQLNEFNAFDILVSNGLNIYEPSDNKVVALYEQFFAAVKPGGYLITSALTAPPGRDKLSEWDMDKIDFFDLEKQMAMFTYVLQARWSHFRTSSETVQQLKIAGFRDIEVLWDRQRIFPTFVAKKAL